MDLTGALASHPDFSRLVEADREALAAAFTLANHPPGHVLVEEGARADAAWLILDGEVAVTRRREPYVDELVRLGPGELFGLASLVSGVRRTASCTATADVSVARIEKFSVEALLRDHAPVGLALQRAVMRQLAADHRRVSAKLHDLLARQHGA